MIRRFQEADAPQVSALIRQTLRISNAADYPPEEIEALVQRHTPEYLCSRALQTHFYVLEHDGEICACGAIGSYAPAPEDACLFTIFTHPDHQHKGYGRQIIAALESDPLFALAGCVHIPASITACGFYEKLGYTHRGGLPELDKNHLYHLIK